MDTNKKQLPHLLLVATGATQAMTWLFFFWLPEKERATRAPGRTETRENFYEQQRWDKRIDDDDFLPPFVPRIGLPIALLLIGSSDLPVSCKRLNQHRLWGSLF